MNLHIGGVIIHNTAIFIAMKRNINTTSLTKGFIESKIPQELIVSKYLNIPLDVVKECINNNRLIESVFREDDTNKSMGIQYNAKGRLKVRDFGGFGFFEDVYGTVAYVLSKMYNRIIDTNNKNDFYFVLKHIATTFSNLIDGKETDEDISDLIDATLTKVKKDKAIIELVSRSWNKKDAAIWKSYGVDLKYLNTHFVIPVDQYYINRTADSNPKYRYSESDPCYAYMLGQNKQGIYLIKLYFPLRDRKKQTKFVTNCNVLEGLPNLELNNYDYILITKSSKDRLSIGCHLSNFFYGGASINVKIGIVNLPSESYKLNQAEYDYLINKLAPNGQIFSLLDFDKTGRLGAKYLLETYGIPYLFITRGEFGLPNYGCKDFADLHSKYTTETINDFISQTFTYIKIKYGRENFKDIPFANIY